MSQAATPIRQLIIIDRQVNDWRSLASNVDTDSLVLILDSSSDGLTQISDYLTALSTNDFMPLQSIHIISHGSEGSLLLGSSLVTAGNLSQYSSQLAAIGHALSTTGDLMLYGCNVAQGNQGQVFISALASATGADVSASTDLTGNALFGGNWLLEAATGAIEAGTLSANIAGVLQVITGTVDDESLSGTGNNDQIYALAGNDWVCGGLGDDILDGGLGFDGADYGDATSGVTVSLALTGQQDTGGAGLDTLTDIEMLSGSLFNDTLTGNALDNVLRGSDGDDSLAGGDGNDWLNGGKGSNSMNGGLGIDGADYGDAATGVTVNLALTGQQDTGGAGIDTLTAIEMLNGSLFNDTLTGDTLDNSLWGSDGDDSLAGGDGNDWLIGGKGNDSMDGGTGNDGADYDDEGTTAGITVSLALAGQQDTGGAGFDILTSIERLKGSRFNDTLTGNALSNVLWGNAGDDIVYGGSGDDWLCGGEGNDTLNGDSGFDTASYEDATGGVVVNLALTGQQDTVGAGLDILTSIEMLKGSLFNDTLSGNTLDNQLYAYDGNDILNGGDGNDWLSGGAGNDLVNGGAGDDTANYDDATAGVTVSLALNGLQNTIGAGLDTLTSIERLSGSLFSDTLTGDSFANTLWGNDGHDSLTGGDGNDWLIGGKGNDSMNGGAGIDGAAYEDATAGITVSLALSGQQNTIGAGLDTLINIEILVGSSFNDTLTGNTLDNQLSGKNGNDTLNGGAGNDWLFGGAGNDIMNGGVGNDIVNYEDAVARVAVNLALTSRQNTGGAGLDTLINIESVVGSNFSDTLTGNTLNNQLSGKNGNDSLNGGAGNDWLSGDAGNDILNGGAGNDILVGSLGKDTLTGGLGADRFTFNAATETGITATLRDIIVDFSHNQGDKIDLSAIDANSVLKGNNAFTVLKVGGTFSGVFANQGSLYFDKAAHILYGNNDADNTADFAIQLTGVSTFTTADILA